MRRYSSICAIVGGLTAFLLFTMPVMAETFFIKSIQIEGLRGIPRSTLINYLPVHVGQTFDTSKSNEIISKLFATGLFSDVKVGRQGNYLVIQVNERPIINRIVITGNKKIPTDKLNDVLKSLGLVQGQSFNNSLLDRLTIQLQKQYDSLGKYAARVITSISHLPNNRVSINIDISEGLTAQVQGIHIIGNKAFSEKKLIKALPLSSPHFWSFFTDSDQYNGDKLDATTEALKAFYLNRGYVRFQINSTEAGLTPDRKNIFININVTEGPVYIIKSSKLSGNLLLDQTKLKDLVTIPSGSVFSREKVLAAETGIKNALGDLGYAFATVTTVPIIDDQSKTVSLNFYVDPGNRIYVHQINITGNYKTQDIAFRRILRQNEASLFSKSDIEESIRQIGLSQLIEQGSSGIPNPQLSTSPVAGAPDEVDVGLNLSEGHAAQATFSVGYGTNGPTIGAAINQNNVFGTGNAMSVAFNTTLAVKQYSLSYTNPYYTLDGVQRSFGFYYVKSTPGYLNTTAYSTNSYGANLSYSIPFDALGDSLNLGNSIQKLELNLPPAQSAEVEKFTTEYGTSFTQYTFNPQLTRNTLDRIIFPTSGGYQSLNLGLTFPLGGKFLSYYKSNYLGSIYLPLSSSGMWILQGSTNLGYGNNLKSNLGLPFFANYYAGGLIGSSTGNVRGYETNTLGPRDSNGQPFGGNILTTGTVDLIFPSFMGDRVRTTAFLDAGNVYSSIGVSKPALPGQAVGSPLGGTSSGPLRYSTGLSLDWQVPAFNVVFQFSLAKALNVHPGDQSQIFQFTLGTGL